MKEMVEGEGVKVIGGRGGDGGRGGSEGDWWKGRE